MLVAIALEGATYVESRGLKVATNAEILAPTSHNAARHISHKMWSSTSYDGRGFWLCQKRLSRGRFGFWPRSATAVTKTLEAHEFYVLLAGGDPASARAAPVWRPVSVAS